MHFPFYQDEYDSDETIAFTVNYCETNNYISTDVIKSKKPILLTQDILEKRRIKGTILGAVPKIWLGVPLIVRNKVIGVMAAQHYHDPDYFSQREMELFIAVSDQVAIAIDRRQFQEDLKEAKNKTDQANKELNNEINERKHSENINKTLFAISNAVNMTLNLYDLYQQIHNYLGRIIDVTNFFIAIVDRKKQTLNFPYHVDTQDDDFSPITNFNPDESLSGLVVTQRKPVMLNKTQLKKITAQKRALGPVSLIWLGVPLVIRNEVIGLISVQSYTDPHLYTHQDLQILSSVSDQVAIAIDRKLTEEGLRASEKRYRHLFDNAPTAMYEIDFLKENFTNVNKTMCTSFGYTKEEFLSMTPLNLFTDQSKKLFKKGYKNLLKGNHKSDNIEYTIKRRDGQERSVILNYDFISKNSEIIGAQVVVHDITERKKIEAMMIQSEKMLSVGGLAAGMAHEINNPLASIMQNAQVVLNRLTKTLPANEEEALKAGTTMAAINKYIERRKICQLLENIHKAGSNAATIVNNMLSFAKKGNASKTNCSLPELVNKTIELPQSDYDLKKKYDFREIKIINEFDPLTPEVLCEESKLLQVLFNIIKNAAEAMYGEGQKKVLPQLIFRIFKAGDLARLEIEDNGPGMDETTRKRIFEPFFTTKDVSRGTGLGLSLSYFIIVDDHNGALEAESTLGKGTKFIITLPVA
ncbi:MAG: GAF domain-containing protein [Desulfobacter sp.]|nr:GAF domain-containing protein [Desulfobacter sp.]